MLSRHLPKPRQIRFLRPHRPPNPPQPRPFTQNTQLLLIAPSTLRPQLPYLAQPTFKPHTQNTRLISTETKAYIRDLSYQSGKWTAIIFAFFALGAIIMEGLEMESQERKKPTPHDWKWGTRDHLRRARAEMAAIVEQRSPIVDWPKAGSHLKECLGRLEDVEFEGKGLVVQGGSADDGEEGGILIPDVGKAGYDIDAKSYEWKAGYFEVLMGCATAAEHLDSMVLDKKRKKVFPREVMIGPSNPDPRPTPIYMESAPKEEDCVKFFEPPETFYMRVLTTKGFGTRQRLEAVEGYANWLEFKGLNESAQEMYKWGIDIAKTALPDSAFADEVIDAHTSVLKPSANREATPNLLRATTALATRHARTGQTALALPIFLSVLRARRTAPLSSLTLDDLDTGPQAPSTDIGAAVEMVKGWIVSPPFPPEPPSGDTPLVRMSAKPTCEEGELMVYIGEILFASASGGKDKERLGEGVGWTRQGVLIAEANLAGKQNGRDGSQSEEKEDRDRKCKECLLTGVQNWETMLRFLSSQRVETSTREGSRDAGFLEWRGWFGGGGGKKGQTLEEVGVGVLEEELKQVERLRERIVREGIEEEMMKRRAEGGLWFG